MHYAAENHEPLIDANTEKDLVHMQFVDIVHKLIVSEANRDQASWEAMYLSHQFALQVGGLAGVPGDNLKLRDFARDLMDHHAHNIEEVASRFLEANEHIGELVDLYMDDIDQSHRHPQLVTTMAGYTFFMLSESQPDSEINQFHDDIQDWDGNLDNL